MRLVLIALGLLSLVPIVLQQMLRASEIYDIRLVGGLHPVDLFALRTVGQCSCVCPAIIVAALVASVIRPTVTLTRWLIAISVATFLIYLILFLFLTVNVIELRVPV